MVHSGVDPRMRPQDPSTVSEVLGRLNLSDPYFLYVGRNHPRKNLGMLRRAFDDAQGAASTPAWSSPVRATTLN